MNIVYGGSFNPPTLAHLEIIDLLIERFKPENVIILPVGKKYVLKTNLASDLDRLNMLKLMLKDKKVIISTLEMEDTKFKGTFYSLEELGKTYSDLYFVLGADNLCNLKSWINYQGLMEKYNFIALSRDGLDCSNYIKNNYCEYLKHFITVEFNNPISSSMIRNSITKHKNMLDSDVYEYIVKNKLYEAGE